MYNIDFYYKNIGRYILYLKYSNIKYLHSNIIEINKFIIYFNLKNVIDLNNLSIFSCIYFFKYYLGVIPFFSNYEHKFHLNVHYYNFLIQYNFLYKYKYYPLYFFLNDVYFMIKKIYINFKEGSNFFEYTINDMNFFIEKNNLLGFYYLKYNVNFKIEFTLFDNFDSKNILYIFKLKS